MKQKIAKFMLFIYIKHIKEDWDLLNSFGKFCIYPFWFIRSVLIWMVSPLLIPQYLFMNSQIYQNFQQMKGMNIDEMREFNKRNTANFIQSKYNKRGNRPKNYMS